MEILGFLDLVMAKAKSAGRSRGILPALNEQGYWHLLKARHPLIPPQSVVPMDLQLEDGKSTLIITGANTGGKTVALKTLGLLTLTAQCGIPIPAAEGSEVGVFDDIFADIGDEQSLQDNLSTFSAWIQTAARIVKAAGPSSLILLDEVGGGTDPTEGAALTMALIDGLRARGAKTVVTTHLQLLKAYGAIHPDVVNVSVEFDPETLRPTYRLIYGRPGESYALLMAEKWGFPPDLIEKAKALSGRRRPPGRGVAPEFGANAERNGSPAAGMGSMAAGSRSHPGRSRSFPASNRGGRLGKSLPRPGKKPKCWFSRPKKSSGG